MLVDGKPMPVRALIPRRLSCLSGAHGGCAAIAGEPADPAAAQARSGAARALKQEWTVAATRPRWSARPISAGAYHSSRRIELERNPFYWGRDERGGALPYLDRLTLAIVRDQNTERLRLENGQIDIGAREIRADDYATLRRDEARGRLRLVDAGIGLDPNMLWFNLSPEAYPGDPRKQWLQSADLRRAISLAVDRRAVVDQVYWARQCR